jgi:hypothetical protein
MGLAMLQLKVLREDLYLPTNPQSRLVGVVVDSATPMQSAAKVPILVGFRVRHRRPVTPNVPEHIVLPTLVQAIVPIEN